jgi:hypothetical protein
VLAIVYADRRDLAESPGSLLGKGIIGWFVFLILARQTRKQRTQSRDLDAKVEELAKSAEQARRRAYAQGSGAGKSG